MAAAIMKIEQQVCSEQLQPEFDGIRYADVKIHTEFKMRKSGPPQLLSKMAAAAMLKIDYQLQREQSQADFDETWYKDVKTPAQLEKL